MPEVESIYGGGDDDEDMSEDEEDDDDGIGLGMLSGKFRLAGSAGSSSVRRLSSRLKKSFSTPSFKSFLDNNVAAASLLLSPPPSQQNPRLPTYPKTFEAVQDDEDEDDDSSYYH